MQVCFGIRIMESFRNMIPMSQSIIPNMFGNGVSTAIIAAAKRLVIAAMSSSFDCFVLVVSVFCTIIFPFVSWFCVSP
jgi:hypothetical protein